MSLSRLAIWIVPAILLGSGMPGIAGTAQTINFPEIPNQITSGGPILLAATSTSGLPVSYSVTGAGNIATLAGDTLTLTGTAGSVTVRARQAGNGSIDPAPDTYRSFTVGAASDAFATIARGPMANHSAGIRVDGTLWTWGENGYGQLGDGTTTQRLSAVQIGNDADWTAVACGGYHTVAIRNDGTLWSWGDNSSGQLGDGTNTDRITPVQIGNASDWSAIACGRLHTAAVRGDGTLWTWGENGNGQLGDGSLTDRLNPTQIGTASNWVKVACGRLHTLALNVDGNLWAWGNNTYGQLGDGTSTYRPNPVQIATGGEWESLACGEYHTLAIQTNGTLWAWGDNRFNQLGDGTILERRSPVQIGGAATWSTVACGGYFSLAVRSTGSLWAWGVNHNGQLGYGTTISRTFPYEVNSATTWTEIACGNFHSLALRGNGTLYSWGYNDDGQLGGGDISHRPNQVPAPSGAIWSSIVCGGYHTMAIRNDGRLWSWGFNFSGQLGNGSSSHRANPALVFSSTNQWLSVGCGWSHTLAVRSDGTLWAWGDNSKGQLGRGNTISDLALSEVGGGNVWGSVACGEYHTLAIRNDGTLWCWGDNSSGQLGDGSTTDRSSAIQAGSATDWISVAGGASHSVGLRGDGTLWAWGDNSNGQLGNGTTTDLPVPTQVGSANDWASVSCGRFHTIALRSDGSLWAWGANSFGQIGDGNTFDRLSPVQIGNVNDWISVSGGGYHNLGLRSDGTIWAWGSNAYGQLGHDLSSVRTSPEMVGSGGGWSALPKTLGFRRSAALTPDGALWTWGDVTNGGLGRVEVFSSNLGIWPKRGLQVLEFEPISEFIVGRPLLLDASSGSGLPVTYGVTGPAVLSGNTLTATGPGEIQIVAYQAGDNSWQATDPMSFDLLSITSPEIDLSGNNNEILNTDTSPERLNHTDFGGAAVPGGVVTRTFTITNSGSAPLNLTGAAPDYVTISGSSAFTIATQPASASIVPESSTTFSISFSGAAGAHAATVTIPSNDSDETPFTFVVARGSSTSVPFVADVAEFDRSILPDDYQVYAFTLAGPRVVALIASEGADLRAILRQSNGSEIASATGGGDFSLMEFLEAGDYILELSRQPGSGPAQNYHLKIDASQFAATRPDVSVGSSPSLLSGREVYSPDGQGIVSPSIKANPVTSYFAVANRGYLRDAIAVRATGGSPLFKVAYYGPAGNATAALVAGTYLTPEFESSDFGDLIRVSVTPDKRKLIKKKKGKKAKILKKSHFLRITANSTSEPAIEDAAVITVRTE